jgi:hypothetical protein
MHVVDLLKETQELIFLTEFMLNSFSQNEIKLFCPLN